MVSVTMSKNDNRLARIRCRYVCHLCGRKMASADNPMKVRYNDFADVFLCSDCVDNGGRTRIALEKIQRRKDR